MNKSAILNGAADLLEAEGWIQKASYIPGLGRCMFGAILEVSQQMTPVRYRRIPHEYEEILTHMAKHLGYSPDRWNDEPGRTKEEVIAKLREEAKEIDNG